ncbi:MAG: hypothetical protein HEP71_08935 [Roseivirga sp.]|nr:hypothetical protein [Roseivirga sp.]
MLRYATRSYFLCIMMLYAMPCIGQIDSTFIKGELVLEDGFYGADKHSFKNPMFFASENDSDYYFLNQEKHIGFEAFSHTEYEYRENENFHILHIFFKKENYDLWREFTRQLIDKHVVLIVKNKAIEVRGVMGEIPNGRSVVGGPSWTKLELIRLQKAIDK